MPLNTKNETPRETSINPMIKSFFVSTLLPMFSFETFFVLFLFSYQFKHMNPLFEIYDVTFFLAIGLLVFFAILYRRIAPHRFWDALTSSLFLFFLWVVLSGVWSLSTGYYKFNKCISLFLYTFPGFIMAYHLISRSTERYERLTSALIIFGCLIVTETLRVYISNPISITDILGNNYLVTGQTIGVSIICLSCITLQKLEDKKFLHLTGLLLLTGISSFALLSTGGRGPVLAIFFTALCLLALPSKLAGNHKQRFICIVGIITTTILIYSLMKLYINFESMHFYARLPSTLGEAQLDGPLLERWQYYMSAMRAFIENPIIGVGAGGWPIFHGIGEKGIHPHNIFLEIISETGIIGLFLFLLVFYSFFRITRTYHTSTIRTSFLPFILIFPFSFFNAMKSGDLNDNILLFVSIGLVAGVLEQRDNKPVRVFARNIKK